MLALGMGPSPFPPLSPPPLFLPFGSNQNSPAIAHGLLRSEDQSPIWNSSNYNAQFTLKLPTSAACMGDLAIATYKLPHALLANSLRLIGTGTTQTSSSVQNAMTWQNTVLIGLLFSNSSHARQMLYPHPFYYPTCLSTYTRKQ